MDDPLSKSCLLPCLAPGNWISFFTGHLDQTYDLTKGLWMNCSSFSINMWCFRRFWAQFTSEFHYAQKIYYSISPTRATVWLFNHLLAQIQMSSSGKESKQTEFITRWQWLSLQHNKQFVVLFWYQMTLPRYTKNKKINNK